MKSHMKHNLTSALVGVLLVNAFLLTPIQKDPWLCFYLSLCFGLIPMGFDWRSSEDAFDE